MRSARRQASSSGPPRSRDDDRGDERHDAVGRRDALERLGQRQPARVRRVPGGGRRAQLRPGVAHAQDRRGEVLRRGRRRDEAVDALLDQLGRGVVGVGDHHARRAGRARLDDDEPVALAARGQHHAERAPQRGVDPRVRRRSPGPRRVGQPELATAQHAPALGPVAVDLGPQLRAAAATPAPAPAPGRASPGCGGPRRRRGSSRHKARPERQRRRPRTRPRAPSPRRARPPRAAARRAAARSRTPAGGGARTPAGPASRPSRRRGRGSRASTRASTARASRRPAGSRAERRRNPPRAGRSRGTRRCGRRRSGGRGPRRCASTPSPNTSGGPIRRRPERGVERQPRPAAHDADARHARIGAPRPLAQRQVGDLVAVGAEPLGEVAVPALGAADGVGEEAVVDEADAHGAQPITAAADTCLVQP